MDNHFTCLPLFNSNSRNAMFDGYADGDQLTPSAFGAMSIQAKTAEEAAEQIFAMFNADHRPNGSIERSLSVGDVVRVAQEREVVFLSVEGSGFRKVKL